MKIIDSVKDLYFKQDYKPAAVIEGVKVTHIKSFIADEGDFSEIIRLSDGGKLELFPQFRLKQINRTSLTSGNIKAWHFHFLQDEIWYVPPQFKITAGLWDLRADSPSAGLQNKYVLGGGQGALLYIPKGVAHGSVNHTNHDAQLYYFVNRCFNAENPDEFRLHWDAAGSEFWLPERD